MIHAFFGSAKFFCFVLFFFFCNISLSTSINMNWHHIIEARRLSLILRGRFFFFQRTKVALTSCKVGVIGLCDFHARSPFS